MNRGRVCLLVALCSLAPGCELERREVWRRDGLSDLAEGRSGQMDGLVGSSDSRGGYFDADGKPRNPLRAEDETGGVRLVSRAPSHVVTHLRQTMMAEEWDLLLDQVISDKTKTEYLRRGLDPGEIIVFFQENKKDIQKFLTRIAHGELSGGAFMRPRPGGVYRLEVKTGVRGLRFTKLDVIWEHGVCRLVVIE